MDNIETCDSCTLPINPAQLVRVNLGHTVYVFHELCAYTDGFIDNPPS
ncbi:hypothetical protein SEA_SCHIMMELS22_27 [Microbacterium phage Schimmels22]|nr:hypothetical protein SEA_HERCULESXL_27 [Microbacterium phage HerculesXL]WNN96058.1 hypothetical protein SEA_SCHIMMELS22_27 [Microbacterium phage Schimmels22]